MRYPVLFFGLLVLSGCATQGAVREVQSDIRWQMRDLSLKVAAVDSALQDQKKFQKQQQADFALDQEALKSQMEQIQARLDELALRLADLHRLLDSEAGRRRRSSTPTLVPETDTTAKVDASKFLDAQELYRMGFDNVEAKNYPVAISTFTQFLDSFATHELADNACYWLGECYYAQNQFADAIGAFERVLHDYPASDKAPGAMLKMGYALVEMKKKTAGIRTLQNVVAQYPDRSEAQLAKNRLRALGAGAKTGSGK